MEKQGGVFIQAIVDTSDVLNALIDKSESMQKCAVFQWGNKGEQCPV